MAMLYPQLLGPIARANHSGQSPDIYKKCIIFILVFIFTLSIDILFCIHYYRFHYEFYQFYYL